MEYWLSFFPELKELTIKEKFNPQKTTKYFYQLYNVDFSQTELNSFIEKYLAKQILSMNKNKEIIDLVINIRRGDYYNDKHCNIYGFNQIEYVKNALQHICLEEISSIYVISDDIEWCKKHLSFISHKNMIYSTQSTPIEDFLTLCRAKRLIITNSTFSYWGAYISEYLHQAKVIAPNFHNINFVGNKRESSDWILLDVDRKDFV